MASRNSATILALVPGDLYAPLMLPSVTLTIAGALISPSSTVDAPVLTIMVCPPESAVGAGPVLTVVIPSPARKPTRGSLPL